MRQLAPIAFFAYNRPEHTRLALESLSKNVLADESVLWIFVDGPKAGASEETKAAIAAVREVVAQKKWCKEVHIMASEVNKGMFKANIEGITKIVSEYGKIIALEDDGILSPGFLTYMNDALDFYENTPQVMHVSAYTRPDLQPAVDKVEASTYFYYHTTTWGWGTWKRAWDKYTTDALAVRKAITAKGNIKKLNMDGTFEFYWGLKAVAKKQFSWNTIWHSIVFLHDGLCLYPKKSLVDNIGHDGSGTNCLPDDRFTQKEALADHIAVTAIPLTLHEGVRRYYVSMHSIGYRLKFAAKHYLRYLVK
ncbi:glycosyltransferase family 2 protein [Ferruginibacter sp. SUN106]|uniref:glycosyltransferase family 2 protein n=1 Tax=Ferruginibacter sp. SUN106 TaxID=2978348 RepID=UPI003D366EBB